MPASGLARTRQGRKMVTELSLEPGSELRRAVVDVVGVGLNATDVFYIVPNYPQLGGKVRILSSSFQPGGQVATALVACRRLGLSARYVGKVGDDDAGRVQLASLAREGMDTRHTRVVRRTPTQIGVIVVDRSTGERTVFWHRHQRLALRASELSRDAIVTARALHLDGCDVAACRAAARWARAAGIPVVADLDTVYAKIETLLPLVDYLVASTGFLFAFAGTKDHCRALRQVAKEFENPAAGVTLGADGALLLWRGSFIYSPGFAVEAVDTTGAGDVFHGAFIYGLLAGWEMPRVLDFSNALAGLNCTALGARGGIASRASAEELMRRGRRRVNRAFAASRQR
jgi:sulfofructose kinase